jgi:murein L,D-transpeptidase YcbB/YkuD
MSSFRRPLPAQLIFLLTAPAALAAQQSPAVAIAEQVATSPDSDLARLYQSRQFLPFWLGDDGRLDAAGRDALSLLRHAADHGLDPSLYDEPRLSALLARATSEVNPDRRAEADVALSRGVMRYLRDLRQGHARPAWLPRDTTDDLVAAVTRAVAGDAITALAREMAPPFRQYALLQAALRRERSALDTLPGDRETLQRIELIGIALERLRWTPRNLAGRLIIINVPSFELVALGNPADGARQELRSRAIVGSANRSPTPMLSDTMTMVEFWPYWNVPRSILLAEILPPLRRNPRYLRARAMEVVNAEGQVIGDLGAPSILAGLADGSLTVRQRPSRTNALGVVKFLFPNTAGVAAHDTPDRTLFDRERRDFSHGCVRVEEAASLAQWVMAREPGWTADRVEAALRGPTTERVTLSQPIPVLIIYTTAVASPDGEMRYFDDLYGLDSSVAKRLREP